MEWTDGNVVTEGIRLHYVRGGQGSPVLLLHGVTDNGRCWGRTADALAQSHDVILLDQRAHGHSEAPEQGYTLDDLAGDAARVARELGIVPAAVLGHSLGARVGITLAASYPDLVSRLVLNDPPLNEGWSQATQPDQDEDQVRYQWFDALRRLRSLSRDQLIERCLAESPNWSEEERSAWADSKLQVNPRLWGSGGLDLGGPWRPKLARIACPVLLVRGDVALGSIVDDAHAAEAMQLLQHGSDMHIAGAGHSIHRDQFDAFISAVGPFLDDKGTGM